RVLAAGNRRFQVVTRAHKLRPHLHGRVVAAFLGRRDARVIMADAVQRTAHQVVGLQPRVDGLFPELRDPRPVRADVAKISDSNCFPVADVEGIRRASLPSMPRRGDESERTRNSRRRPVFPGQAVHRDADRYAPRLGAFALHTRSSCQYWPSMTNLSVAWLRSKRRS